MDTHRRIVRVAAAALPAGVRSKIEASPDGLLEGSTFPDLVLKDGEHHSFCPDRYCGDAPAYLEAEFSRMVSDFGPKSRWKKLAYLAALLPAGCSTGSDVTGPSPEQNADLAFRLGLISHYLADVNCPYHARPFEGAYTARHLQFENWVDRNLDSLGFLFDGAYDDVGGDPRGFAVSRARAAYEDVLVLEDPAVGQGSPRYREVVNRSYSRAVNGVIDLWYSIVKRIGEWR